MEEFGILGGIKDSKLFSISTDNGSSVIAGLDFFCANIVDNSDIGSQESQDGSIINEEAVCEMSACEEENSDNERDKNIVHGDEFSQIYGKRILCTNHLLSNNFKPPFRYIKNIPKLCQFDISANFSIAVKYQHKYAEK